MHKSFTTIKLNEFLNALPSKRLVMQFVDSVPVEVLANELSSYFGLVRDCEKIAVILKALVRTDMEWGIYQGNLQAIQDRYDSLVKILSQKEMIAKLPDLELRIASRLRSSIGATERDIISTELEIVEAAIGNFVTLSEETMLTQARLSEKFRKSNLSILELEKKRDALKMLDCVKAGTVYNIVTKVEIRQDWVRRLNAAMSAPEKTKAEKEAKYSEIRLVGKEFLDYAKGDAMTIIAEYYQVTLTLSSLSPLLEFLSISVYPSITLPLYPYHPNTLTP